MRKITIIIMIITTSVLVAWDIVAVISPEPNDTISTLINKISADWLALPFAFGALMGHFFWPRKTMPTVRNYWFGFGSLVGLVLLLALFKTVAARLFLNHMTIALLVGIPLGAFLWPQRTPSADK